MIERNEKGQFAKTTGLRQYHTVQWQGIKMQRSRKVWIQNHGAIPEGNIVHHINENKTDDRIENLKCITYKVHNNIHKHTPWNKGLTNKNPRVQKQLLKAIKTRRRNYAERCQTIYEYKNFSGETYEDLVSLFGISDRQLWAGYKKHEAYLIKNGEKIFNEKPICKRCGESKKHFRKELCRPCYERQNPRSKFYSM